MTSMPMFSCDSPSLNGRFDYLLMRSIIGIAFITVTRKRPVASHAWASLNLIIVVPLLILGRGGSPIIRRWSFNF
ncbi:hypothetical protein K439DRAFT_1638602 [Ramaria rubella]|nr:hypothetical protein K439DRAFT_1638602 [Ramaria rubella]